MQFSTIENFLESSTQDLQFSQMELLSEGLEHVDITTE